MQPLGGPLFRQLSDTPCLFLSFTQALLIALIGAELFIRLLATLFHARPLDPSERFFFGAVPLSLSSASRR